MEPKRALTLMAFPQRFDGKKLFFNIVLIPRNADPFALFPTGLTNPENVPGFAKLQPEFEAAIVKGLDDFPLSNATAPGRVPVLKTIALTAVPNKGENIKSVANLFHPITISDTSDKIPAPLEVNRSVKKYLPHSYRKSFNFTQPRHPNAVTDDSYECALRDKVEEIVNYKPKENISWGKVFAHILRQPLLAKACGLIYECELEVEPEWFEEGGYLYINLKNDLWSESQNQLLEEDDGPLVKRYAARIPKLEENISRAVFAPVLFPVLYQKKNAPEVVPSAPWDELFKEAMVYSDGFAKIVHANQPVSGNLLKEQQDGFHPQNDAGIRLAWDDEQILVWYIRQLIENPEEPASGKRVDVPLGVMGYKIDVREQGPDLTWESLHSVHLKHGLTGLGDVMSNEPVELSHQVYPTKVNVVGGNSSYWLPMYFANWVGKNLAVGDDDALEIYKNDQPNAGDIEGNNIRQAQVNKALEPAAMKTKLLYGRTYQFRVRMSDISGGGPLISNEPLHNGPSPQSTVSFKRYVAPDKLLINKPTNLYEKQKEYFNSLNEKETEFDATPYFLIKRPLLEYPAVVFTDKYQKAGMDPIAMLKAIPAQDKSQVTLGLPDPDVTKVKVVVEVRTLGMDHQLSKDGRENYIPLYTTFRRFPDGFEEELTVPIQFIDVPVLNLGNTTNPFLHDNYKKADLDNLEEIILPSGRHIRISLSGVAESEQEDSYFGVIDEARPELDSRMGKVQQFMFYKEPSEENVLLIPYKGIPTLQGLFLRQNDYPVKKGRTVEERFFKERVGDTNPDIVKRLADALGLRAKGLTLVAPKGERVVFGVSHRIRHSLSPEGSSVTFADKAELQDHWLGCISYKVNRDWAWDALENTSFVLERTSQFRKDSEVTHLKHLGDIEFKHTVSFEALQPDRFGNISRDHTRIVFIDAIEPKNGILKNGNPRFPDEIWVNYTIHPKFKEDHAATPETTAEELKLPTVLPPSQIPKLASVGIAFSPYERNETYDTTEARRRFLWVEFTEPVENEDDAIFCRVLANAPDQLISKNEFAQLIVPEEEAISLDPEYTRKIIPGQSDDMAGLGAMQPMIKAADSDIHYLLPIPEGMYPESPELFGFFTYEFRVGHAQWPDREDNLWSTAQGRFGRPLRVTGIQHPAPTLLCSLNRDEHHLYVSAPFAKAVFKGKNVTAKPPRTSLWAILYTQVRQADGRDYRNILLDEKQMLHDFKLKVDKKEIKEKQKLQSKFITINQPMNVAGSINLQIENLKLGALLAQAKDQHSVGTTAFTSQEIANRLIRFGLPEDSPLSILVVEVFGQITNLRDHMDIGRDRTSAVMEERTYEEIRARSVETNSPDRILPLSNSLGHFRILRTSPLTKVPFVCCPTCEY